jgi:hypothetical protein
MPIEYREATIYTRFSRRTKQWVATVYHNGRMVAQKRDKNRLKAIAKAKGEVDLLLDE